MIPHGQAVGDSGRQVAESFNAAAKMYADNPTAFRLRAMNMLNEGLKRSNAAIVIVPSTAVESMQLGGMPTMATVASAIAPAQSGGRLELRPRREGEPFGAGLHSVLNDPPSFMMARKFFPGSSMSLRSASGPPSTTMRSASAPDGSAGGPAQAGVGASARMSFSV